MYSQHGDGVAGACFVPVFATAVFIAGRPYPRGRVAQFVVINRQRLTILCAVGKWVRRSNGTQ